MKLTVNGQDREDFVSADKNLKDFIGYVAKTYVSSEEIISGVKLDGEAVSLEDDSKILETCSSIEVNTTPTSKLLVDGLLQAHQMLGSFQSRMEGMADALMTPQHQNALKELAECMVTVQWFDKLIDGIKRLMGVTLQDNQAGVTVDEYRVKLKDTLSQINQSLQNENYVLVSDIIRYDLVPCLRDLQTIMTSLIKEVDRKISALS